MSLDLIILLYFTNNTFITIIFLKNDSTLFESFYSYFFIQRKLFAALNWWIIFQNRQGQQMWKINDTKVFAHCLFGRGCSKPILRHLYHSSGWRSSRVVFPLKGNHSTVSFRHLLVMGIWENDGKPSAAEKKTSIFTVSEVGRCRVEILVPKKLGPSNCPATYAI